MVNPGPAPAPAPAPARQVNPGPAPAPAPAPPPAFSLFNPTAGQTKFDKSIPRDVFHNVVGSQYANSSSPPLS